MNNKTLQLQQLNHKMLAYSSLKKVTIPADGWIKAIRNATGMSMQQLGNKLKITKQGVLDMEKREKEGAITIKSLREIAFAMDMQVVYGFAPNDGSLNKLIEKRALQLATKIVRRTANTMKLEGQSNSKKRLQAAIKERAAEIKSQMPKVLWD